MSNNTGKSSRLNLPIIIVVFFFVFIVTTVSAFAFETKNFQIHLKIANMEKAEKPLILEDHVFISYQTDKLIRFVGAAFSHESFSEIHSFVRNAQGVFVLVYPVPENVSEISYRIVVDGLWMADPMNTDRVEDPSGITLSRISLPRKELNRWKLVTPVIHDDNSVDFHYFGPKGVNVYLSGSFNNWDPYMYKLNEVKPGEYTITLTMLPGTYFYYFVSSGLFLLDPLNPDKGADSEGFEVSMFEIENPYLADNSEDKKGIKLFN